MCYVHNQWYDISCATLYIQAPSLSKCSRGKSISITYSECVSVALVIQYAVRIRGVVLFSVASLFLSSFSHYLINGTSFGKISYWTKNCVMIFSATFVWIISHSKNNWARCYCKYTKVVMWSTRYTWQMKLEIFRRIKFRENLSNGNRVVSCRRNSSARNSQWRSF